MSHNEPFDAVATARGLLRCARTGALATIDAKTGGPYASLVTVATDPDGSPICHLSDLARHTVNLKADSRVSLMVDDQGDGDPLQGARLSVSGAIAVTTDPVSRRRYLARHPGATDYAEFADFNFYRLTPESAHLVAGFGRIVDIAGEDLLLRIGDAAELIAAEADILSHLNSDHRDSLDVMAAGLLGETDGSWAAIACDPGGLDLSDGARIRRLHFPERVLSPDALRNILRQLIPTARANARR